MIKYFSLLLFSLTITNYFAEAQLSQTDLKTVVGQDNINTNQCKANLSIKDSIIIFKKDDDKYIKLVLKNLGNDSIYIPKWFINGKKNDSSAEVIFEVEKWSKKKKKFVPYVSTTVSDYNYETYNRESISLSPNEKIEFIEQIDFCNRIYEPNKYRFKLILRRICQVKEIELDWKEFEVI